MNEFDQLLLEEELNDNFNDVCINDDGDIIDIISGEEKTIEEISEEVNDIELEEADLIKSSLDENDFFDEECFKFDPKELKKGKCF